jgi:hypothetical protein
MKMNIPKHKRMVIKLGYDSRKTVYQFLIITWAIFSSSPSFSIGSIALDKEALKAGISWNAPTKSEADRAALSYCKASNCIVLTNYENQCVALAVGLNGAWGYHLNNSLSQSKKVAIETCKKYEGEECSIIVAHCDPEQTQAKVPPISGPAAPSVKPQAINPIEAKRQKCIRLGLAPGTSDFAQCIN